MSLNQGPSKGGTNARPTSSRPPAPPAQEMEQAPNLEQIEGAKNALLTFVMYHYQALRQEGHSIEEAKQKVADSILELYDRYATQAQLEFRPERLMNPHKLLDDIIQDAKSLGIQGKPLVQKLVDFKNLVKEG